MASTSDIIMQYASRMWIYINIVPVWERFGDITNNKMKAIVPLQLIFEQQCRVEIVAFVLFMCSLREFRCGKATKYVATAVLTRSNGTLRESHFCNIKMSLHAILRCCCLLCSTRLLFASTQSRAVSKKDAHSKPGISHARNSSTSRSSVHYMDGGYEWVRDLCML